MNAIDIYKRLPRKNCGKCIPKACMPFAVALLQGSAAPSDCPLLTEAEARALGDSCTPSDWREDLIESLRTKIRDTDLSAVSRDIGGTWRDGRLFIQCLGREFTVSPDGEIETRGHITPWVRILLLHYINIHGRGDLSGRWVSYSELKSGMVKASSFRREAEEPMKELFDGGMDKTESALEKLGAERAGGFPTPHAWRMFLLPKMPVMVLYWPEEDEFASKAMILFDRTADKFLDAESLIFLLEGLVKNIQMTIDKNK
jgi:hypothetical protein